MCQVKNFDDFYHERKLLFLKKYIKNMVVVSRVVKIRRWSSMFNFYIFFIKTYIVFTDGIRQSFWSSCIETIKFKLGIIFLFLLNDFFFSPSLFKNNLIFLTFQKILIESWQVFFFGFWSVGSLILIESPQVNIYIHVGIHFKVL